MKSVFGLGVPNGGLIMRPVLHEIAARPEKRGDRYAFVTMRRDQPGTLLQMERIQ
jgi:hypothetical protein